MKTILIDDERTARETLAALLRTFCPQVEIVGEADSVESGIELFRLKKPDLVFLDIDLGDQTGFDFLKKVSPTQAAVIFATGFNQYAELAFEFSAVDFLRKPVDPSRLAHAVNRASERHRLLHSQAQYDMLLEMMNQNGAPSVGRADQRIAFSTSTEIVFSWVKNIIHIDADGTISHVFLTDFPKPLAISKNLGVYEELLKSHPAFVRVHKSHLINLYHVKKFDRQNHVLWMTDGTKIPLAERHRDDTLDALRKLGMGD